STYCGTPICILRTACQFERRLKHLPRFLENRFQGTAAKICVTSCEQFCFRKHTATSDSIACCMIHSGTTTSVHSGDRGSAADTLPLVVLYINCRPRRSFDRVRGEIAHVIISRIRGSGSYYCITVGPQP